jgi:2-polyprenyl-3-methyl-5-hydroxy-6-metoxy-1,4-benzoquinol methylase
MNIHHLQQLTAKPNLYQKGTSVMWTDPHISKQLLKLHLNQNHDIASRSGEKIKNLTDWIFKHCNKTNLKILDLGCGPGLYSELIAQKGHAVTGVDFSENSIQYAISQANEKQLDIEYIVKNYLELDFENQFDLVILIYLDFCVLLPEERDKVLSNIYRALKNGGLFILDVVNEKNIEKKILPKSWEIKERGFWKDTPYLTLSNGFHYPDAKVMAEHHLVLGDDDTVQTFIFWNHWYECEEMVSILETKGFSNIKNHENVLPAGDFWNGENITFYVAQKT